MGEASTQVLATIGEDTVENKELQDMLLSLAKAVANTTAALVLKAKNIASTCEDQQTQNRVIGAATQCALATSQLVACAKVVAPTLQNAACQEQLTAAIREVFDVFFLHNYEIINLTLWHQNVSSHTQYCQSN